MQDETRSKMRRRRRTMPDPMFILRGFLGSKERESFDGIVAQVALSTNGPVDYRKLCGPTLCESIAQLGLLRSYCERTGETLIAGIPVGSKE